MENYPSRGMNKLANDLKMWEENGNTTTLLFSLKGLEIVHEERRGQGKIIVMGHFNVILFHKSGPVNKQHTNYSSLPIFRVIKTRRLRWAEYEARMEEFRTYFTILAGKTTEKRPLGRHRRIRENNVRMDLKEIGANARNWVDST